MVRTYVVSTDVGIWAMVHHTHMVIERTKGGNMATERTYTPTELARELDVDPKRLRAYLRKEHTRAIESKNTSGTISEDTANAVRAHFTPKSA